MYYIIILDPGEGNHEMVEAQVLDVQGPEQGNF